MEPPILLSYTPLQPHLVPFKDLERCSYKFSFQHFLFLETTRILTRFEMSMLATRQGCNMAVLLAFWSDNSLLWETGLCIAESLAVSQAPPHRIPGEPPPSCKLQQPNYLQTLPNVILPWGAKSPSVEKHSSYGDFSQKDDFNPGVTETTF